MRRIINKLRYVLLSLFRIKHRFGHNIYDKSNHFGFKAHLLNTKWGHYSSCNSNCNIESAIIGNYTNIAFNVIINPRNHYYSNFTTHDLIYDLSEISYKNYELPYNGYSVSIGSDVWIGCNSIIFSGVNIGNGAIIAAGSVVTKSVPKYAIIGGNPAKFIKWRFDPKIANELESTRWFEKSHEDVISNRSRYEKIVSFDLKSQRNILNKVKSDVDFS